MAPLLDRLKQRKLGQWGLAYLAGAWLLLQILSLLADPFAWPDGVLRAATILLAIGFFAALVLAWYHGERGAQRVSSIELLMLAGILVIAGVGVAWVDGGVVPARTGSAAQPPTPAAVEDGSIAVLPFANLSADPDNEYFSDGITDEILMTLANVGDLRVISRTSVMQYKRTTKPIRQIAGELGVAHILEGSVQRAGDQVRITAQLIDARTDKHLWADRYDRPLEDLFAVQSEIARQIAAALQAELSPAESARVERRPTASSTAYQYVLKGREYHDRIRRSDNEIAIRLFRRALEHDPGYADAHAGLAAAFRFQYLFSYERSWLDSAVVAARRAISLDGAFAQGHYELGWALNWRGDRDGALEAHRRVVELNPNLSDGLANVYHYDFGRLDEAARWWRPALRRSPTVATGHMLAGRTYMALGMLGPARAYLEKAIELQPDHVWSYHHLQAVLLLEGRRAEARAQVGRMLRAAGGNPLHALYGGHMAAAVGDLAAARHYYERAVRGSGGYDLESRLALAWVLQQAGEVDRARELTREAARLLETRWEGREKRPEAYFDDAKVSLLQGDREGALRQVEAAVRGGWRLYRDIATDPMLKALHGDPRFERLMDEVEADVAVMRTRVEREGW